MAGGRSLQLLIRLLSRYRHSRSSLRVSAVILQGWHLRPTCQWGSTPPPWGRTHSEFTRSGATHLSDAALLPVYFLARDYTAGRRSTTQWADYSRHLTANSRTGSSNPLSVTSPVSVKRNPLPAHNSRTASEARISPPSALAAMRAARITAVPNRSPSSSIGSPAFRPMRIRMGSGASARPSLRSGDPSRASERAEPPAFRSAKARWRAMGPSPAFVTAPDAAQKPAP